jgi:hypothetical protein
MGEPVRLDGIHQRVNHVVLPDHILKNLWTPFSGKDFVCHSRCLEKIMTFSSC